MQDLKQKILALKVKSITVKNTGLLDCEVDSIDWIDNKKICISDSVDCVYDDGFGGTCVSSKNEFEYSFVKRDFLSDAYILIEL